MRGDCKDDEIQGRRREEMHHWTGPGTGCLSRCGSNESEDRASQKRKDAAKSTTLPELRGGHVHGVAGGLRYLVDVFGWTRVGGIPT